MFIAALFIIAKIWKPPNCPSIDEWIKKMWYIYQFEMYRNIKSLCCLIETTQSCRSVIIQTPTNQLTKKLTEKEIRLVVTRDGGWEKGELDEGGQKVQTSSYKMNRS